MRVQGHLYARLMKTSEHFWFVVDAKYGRGYDNLSDAQRSMVHRFHRILLRESRLVHVNQDFTNRPRMTEVDAGNLIVSASDDYLSAVYIGPAGLAPERCLRGLDEEDDDRPRNGVVLSSRQTIRDDSPLWEPLMYPVFNLRSSTRWAKRMYFPLIRTFSTRPMTLIAYLRSVILHEKSFWHSSRLAQQFILDCWSRNEQMMAQYWRRADFQQKLRNSLARVTGGRGGPSTGKIFMPSSYAGSSRYCQRNFHDAQFIAACEGICHLFVTMTANPHWAEVQALLPEGHSASDRPDIIARVFSDKVAQFLVRLNTPGYLHPAHLGASWIVYTIEWQQGGLPHVHLAVRLLLDEAIAPMTTNHDHLHFMRQIVSARMPPEGTVEHHLVRAFMVHGHPCMHCVRRRKDGSMGCRFFPKPASETSRVDNKGFPVYERGPQDAWVVPHNLKFLVEFKCHFNTE